MSRLTVEQHRLRAKSLPEIAKSRAEAAGQFSVPFTLNAWLSSEEISQLYQSLQALGSKPRPSFEEFKATYLTQPQAMAE